MSAVGATVRPEYIASSSGRTSLDLVIRSRPDRRSRSVPVAFVWAGQCPITVRRVSTYRDGSIALEGKDEVALRLPAKFAAHGILDQKRCGTVARPQPDGAMALWPAVWTRYGMLGGRSAILRKSPNVVEQRIDSTVVVHLSCFGNHRKVRGEHICSPGLGLIQASRYGDLYNFVCVETTKPLNRGMDGGKSSLSLLADGSLCRNVMW